MEMASSKTRSQTKHVKGAAMVGQSGQSKLGEKIERALAIGGFEFTAKPNQRIFCIQTTEGAFDTISERLGKEIGRLKHRGVLIEKETSKISFVRETHMLSLGNEIMYIVLSLN